VIFHALCSKAEEIRELQVRHPVEQLRGGLSPMKKLSTILAAGAATLTLSTPVLAGSVGIGRSYATAQPNAETIAELQKASEAAQREAREGNKDNPAFAQKSYQIDQLVERMKSGEQVSQNQVDEALQPVWVW
jgi:hypothetical protein